MPRNRKSSDGVGLEDISPTSPSWEIVQALVNGGTDPSELLELYYWTREPGVVEMVRAYLALPEATQHRLGEYLLRTNPARIAAAFNAQGHLVLSRPAAEPNTQSKSLRPPARR